MTSHYRSSARTACTARTAWTLWCAAACVVLAACSGGPASPTAHPSHSRATASAQPTAGPAAIAAVRAAWISVFNGNIPISRRLVLLQDGAKFASFVNSQAKTSIGALVLEASATVSSVTLHPPGQANVVFTILLSGKPLEKNLHGTAVYTGGSWKVADTTFCSLLRLAYGRKSRVLPAACGS
jgi:hypothetical protein